MIHVNMDDVHTSHTLTHWLVMNSCETLELHGDGPRDPTVGERAARMLIVWAWRVCISYNNNTSQFFFLSLFQWAKI